MYLIIKSTPFAFLLVILASNCLAKQLICYECEDSIADNDFSCHYEDKMSERKKVLEVEEVVLKQISLDPLHITTHIELNKGGKRTFANFQAKTLYFRSRF